MLEQVVESSRPQNENVAPALPELWEVAFQPARKGAYPEEFPILDQPVAGGLKPKQPQASKQAYRPPGARGRPPSTFKLHDDDEPAQNAKKSNDQEPISKSAAKNKKRREAAKKKKDETFNSSMNNGAHSTLGNEDRVSTITADCDNSKSLSSDPETDKKLRKLNDKLVAIQKLKQQQKEGKQLEKNQIEKISKEKEILVEIQKLKQQQKEGKQ